MASLLALMNCSISYFTESNNVDCGRSDEFALSIVNDVYDRLWKDCIICDTAINPKYYIKEEQMCKCCHEVSLGKDKQCFSCGGSQAYLIIR
jgi:hypothetical protein